MNDMTLNGPALAGPASGQTCAEKPADGPALDTGLACLVMLARFHGVAADADQLAHEFVVSGQPFQTQDVLLAARQLGLQARRVTQAATAAQHPLHPSPLTR